MLGSSYTVGTVELREIVAVGLEDDVVQQVYFSFLKLNIPQTGLPRATKF